MNIKTQSRKIVCAIYPNSTGYGFVYLENPRKLIDYGAVRIHPFSNRKLLERVKKSFDYFRPSIVIIQDPDGNYARTGKRIRRLIDKIKEYAESEHLKVDQFSRDQIRDVFYNFGVLTKYDIAKYLLTEFKELALKEPKKRKMWTSEDTNMSIFDALSLALTWFYLKE